MMVSATALEETLNSYLVTRQPIRSNALRRKEFPQIKFEQGTPVN
jgi:hypothetical protein